MATRTLFGSRFQNAWIALPGQVEPQAQKEGVSQASFGILHAIVEELAGFGATVHTCSRNEVDLNECLSEWRKKGLQVTGSVCDVSSRAERENLISTASNLFNGKLNILINNVGTNKTKSTLEYTAQDFSFIMATNFESAYHLSQLAHPLLKATSAGSIVFVSSVCGVVSISTGSIYGASKEPAPPRSFLESLYVAVTFSNGGPANSTIDFMRATSKYGPKKKLS
nr:tropinone reductase like [Quercus suber]